MSSASYLLTILSLFLYLTILADGDRVQAKPLACQLPKAGARLPQSYVGTAAGALKVDGKKISLTHAYAIASDPLWENGVALKKTKTTYAVLLTEQAMPANLLETFWLNKVVPPKSVVEGRVKGLSLVLDDKGYNATFLYPPRSGFGFSSFKEGIEPGKLQIATDRISGEITGSASLMQNFEYKLSFKAPIQQSALSTELFVGEAALNTAPVKVYLAYLDAVQQKNIEQMRPLLKNENLQVFNRLIAEIGKDNFFSELRLYIEIAKEFRHIEVANSQKLAELKAKISQLKISRIDKESNISPLEILPINVLSIDSITLKRHLHKVAIRGGESKIFLKFDPNENPVRSTVSLSMLIDGQKLFKPRHVCGQ